MASRVIEFFSGIGAFKFVANELGMDVLAAYDQSDDANAVYSHNFGVSPCGRNLDTISGGEIPQADLWWLSPPCQPFSRRGKKTDLDDPRAQALVNLIALLPQAKPRYFVLENVQGFASSRAERMLMGVLNGQGYHTRKVCICPTQLGIPMQRPRLFYLGSKEGLIGEYSLAEPLVTQAIAAFVDKKNDNDMALYLDPALQLRYADSLNILSLNDPLAKAICFTSGYFRSLKTSGSFIALANGRLRYFSPAEILSLLGFPESFDFPPEMPLACRFRLAGNSVDLRSIKIVLALLCNDEKVFPST